MKAEKLTNAQIRALHLVADGHVCAWWYDRDQPAEFQGLPGTVLTKGVSATTAGALARRGLIRRSGNGIPIRNPLHPDRIRARVDLAVLTPKGRRALEQVVSS